MKQNVIKNALYNIFDKETIDIAFVMAASDDIKYIPTSEFNNIVETIEGKTPEETKSYTDDNFKKFKDVVDKVKLQSPNISMYEGLTEKEKYAVLHLYYRGCYA